MFTSMKLVQFVYACIIFIKAKSVRFTWFLRLFQPRRKEITPFCFSPNTYSNLQQPDSQEPLIKGGNSPFIHTSRGLWVGVFEALFRQARVLCMAVRLDILESKEFYSKGMKGGCIGWNKALLWFGKRDINLIELVFLLRFHRTDTTGNLLRKNGDKVSRYHSISICWNV